MIISTHVNVKIGPNNHKYFKLKGYDVKPLGAPRWGHVAQILSVSVDDLLPGSNIKADFICDDCGAKFTRVFNRGHETCDSCSRSRKMKGNNYGQANKGRIVECITGEKHPRWNPLKDEFKLYLSRVNSETRKWRHIYNTWDNAQNRRLAGVKGGYQLDHIISAKYGFDNGILPSLIGHICNLQIVQWKKNNSKRADCGMSIERLSSLMSFYDVSRTKFQESEKAL